MNFNIEQIEKEMETVGLPPGRLADFRLYLAAIYSHRAAEMQEIEMKKARMWLDLRNGHNSDKATDRAWDLTQTGQREIALRWELRRIEKLTQALASKLRVMETEARNMV